MRWMTLVFALFVLLPGCRKKDSGDDVAVPDLSLELAFERSESSLDSHRSTTSWTLRGAKLVKSDVTTGARSHNSEDKTKLTAKQRADIAALIRNGPLLEDYEASYAGESPHPNFSTSESITLHVTLDGKSAKVRVSGSNGGMDGAEDAKVKALNGLRSALNSSFSVQSR